MIFKLNEMPNGVSLKDFTPGTSVINVVEFNDELITTFSKTITQALALGQKYVFVTINCYGGAVYVLNAILDLMRKGEEDGLIFVTSAQSRAMSCGQFLMSFGTKGYRYAAPSCNILVHDVSSGVAGATADVQVVSEHMLHLSQKLQQELALYCGKPKDYYTNLTFSKKGADIYLTPTEAKKHGLIDHIDVPVYECTVEVKYELKVKTKKK